MDLGLAIVQFVHIGAGAAWFGGSVFANAALLPFIARQSPERQRELVAGVVIGPERVMIGAALGAAVTGLLRGIVYGRIQSLDALGTTYGIVWLASIVVAIAVFATGGRITSPAARAIRDDNAAWSNGGGVAARLLGRLRLGFRLELTGITIILGLMAILPRL